MLEVATKFLTSTELLVITQDNGLSNDLMGLNRLRSVQGKRLSVGRINRYGYLSRYLTKEQRSASGGSRGNGDLRSAATLFPEDRERIPVAQVPSSGVAVFGAKVYRLGRRIATGGEGCIYDLEDGTVAKIYHQDKLTVGRRKLLARVSPRQRPVRLNGLRFREFFAWLSRSVTNVTASLPGDDPGMDPDALQALSAEPWPEDTL